MVVTDKVEMQTDNRSIKKKYDHCHAMASAGKLKPKDYSKVLSLSVLFNCEEEPSLSILSDEYISANYIISEAVKANIELLRAAIQNNVFLRLNQSETLEDMQLNHIILDLFLNSMNKTSLTESSELALIAKYVSCVFNSLWSAHDSMHIKWDKPFQATCKHDPSNYRIRPDIIFCTTIDGKTIELGNGEIKKKTASKAEVDQARVRMLGVIKRQLHLKIKHTSRKEDLVTFGVLLHGLRYEFYVVSYEDGCYPFEKFAWGEFPTADDAFRSLERAFNALMKLKKSMQMSVPLERSDISSTLDADKLLPTVTSHTKYQKNWPQ